jgi:putative phage-type endonuclease
LSLIEINKSVPEQRTPAWLEFRNKRLTASDAAKALLITQYELDLYEKGVLFIETKTPKRGSCCYTGKNIKELYQSKCVNTVYKKLNSPSVVHGTRYEVVACTIYETREQETVIGFGLMPHPNIPFIGASPDGITQRTGRMLEIKVPYSRKIIGIPLIYYWIQMQMQLQCCQLDVCDFVECTIKTYTSEQQFIEDQWVNEDGSVDYHKTHEGLEKGCLIIFEYKLYSANLLISNMYSQRGGLLPNLPPVPASLMLTS